MENTSTTSMPSLAGTVGQSGQIQPGVAAKTQDLGQVQRQVADLRRTLQALMMDDQYADGEIITASAALDAELEDYYHTITEKQPGLKTF